MTKQILTTRLIAYHDIIAVAQTIRICTTNNLIDSNL